MSVRRFAAVLATLVLATGAVEGQQKVKPDEAAVGRAKKALERAAGAEEAARAAALAEVRGAPKIVRFEALARAIETSARKDVRVLAAAEFAEMREPAAAPVIAGAAVREADRPARAAMMRSLGAVGAPDTAVYFARHLSDSDVKRRIRAMQGLTLFRDRRSVPVLVKLVEMLAAGFGQAAVDFTIDRAYIADWEMVSGGTGLVVVETADPEIEVVRQGVSMDVHVRRVEMRFVVGLLRDLTGEAIGADAGAWRSWLAANPDFALAPRKP